MTTRLPDRSTTGAVKEFAAKVLAGDTSEWEQPRTFTQAKAEQQALTTKKPVGFTQEPVQAVLQGKEVVTTAPSIEQVEEFNGIIREGLQRIDGGIMARHLEPQLPIRPRHATPLAAMFGAR